MRIIDADDLPVSSVDFTDVGYYIEKYGTGIPVVYMEDINDAPTIDVDLEQCWIPSSTKPPARQSVILSTKEWTGEGCYWETTEHHVIWKGYRWNATYWDDEVVAWKPLPNPYRGENDGLCDVKVIQQLADLYQIHKE